MNHPKLIVPILTIASLALGACHASMTSGPHGPLGARVDAGLLQYASESDREAVHEARRGIQTAEDELLVAKRKVTEAEGELAIARESLAVAKANYQRAKVEARVEGDAPTEDRQVLNHRTTVWEAEHAVDARELDIVVAKHAVIVAEQRRELALAKVDLAAAKAVTATDRTETRRIDVVDFERAVRAEEADVKVAEVRHEQAVQDAEANRAAAKEALQVRKDAARGE